MAASRYCKRRRKMPLVRGARPDGTFDLTEPVPALITRYRYGAKRRKPHYVYYHQGTWLRARNCAVELDDAGKPCRWEWALEPIAQATAYDAHLAQTVEDGKAAPVSLEIRGGHIVQAVGAAGSVCAGLALLDGSEGPDYIEDLLDLAPRKPARPIGKHFRRPAA